MKASRSFFIVLLSMFMFQAIWNVAAGFCLHEKNTQTLNSQHFGHHQTDLCDMEQVKQYEASITEHSNQHNQDLIDPTDLTQKQGLLDDHHDHLPSFSYFIVAESLSTQHWPDLVYDPHLGDVVWNNLYQSPHLSSQNPPPELTSL